ncbi:MAG: mechanosensitive ion channel family protein [Planctomycetota bacterium]
MRLPRVVFFLSIVLTASAIATPSRGQGESPVASPPPPEHASPREVLKSFLRRMVRDDKVAAAQLLDLSELNAEAVTSRGPDLAFQLFRTMQQLVELPPAEEWPLLESEGAFDRVPDDPQYPRPWHLSDLPRYDVEEAEEIVIAQGGDGWWRFSASTVAMIESLYESAEEQGPRSVFTVETTTTVPLSERVRRLFPAAMQGAVLGLPAYQWVCLIILAAAGLAVQWVVRSLLTPVADAVLHRAEPDFKSTTARVWGPLALLANAATWYWGARAIALPLSVVGWMLVLLKLLTALAAVRAAFAVIDLVALAVRSRAKETTRRFDDLVVPLAATTTKVLASFLGLLVVLAAFSEELPATLLGGLGIGGVALALASQDTLSNFFGSVMVLFDRPFERGDWVVVDGIEGEVEEVGFRSTRIRTGLNSQVTMPNSKLASASVDNMGRREYRRYLTRLGVEYGTTPEQIEAFCEGIRELIRRHPHTRKDFYAAYFNDFGASALEVLLVVYFIVPDWATELRERHRLLADIVRLAERLEVAFAFPTQTVHLFNEEAQRKARPVDDPEKLGDDLAEAIAGELPNYQDRPGRVKFGGQDPSQGVRGPKRQG